MRQIWIPFGVAFAMLMNPASVHADCCAVIELRQYTLKPGQRDALVDVFERHLIESQEATGMTLVGQFRDRRRDDRFVWVRGFADMPARHQALEKFYGGPVWAAHRNAANNTMVDSDDVLLLKPARPDLAFRVDSSLGKAGQPQRGELAVLAGVHRMPQPVDAGTVTPFERHVAPVLRDQGITVEGVFITEYSTNTFTRLPVRENTHVLVWFGTIARDRVAPGAIDRLTGRIAIDGQPVSVLDLSPTPRSKLGGGPNAARSTQHDFDFLFGSWQVHNRYLKGRFKQSTEWVEFDASAVVAPVLHGFGNVDRLSTVRDGEPFEGVTLRLFDPATAEWSIHWADTKYARTLLPPMVGRFTGGVGEFYGDEVVEGKTVKCRFLWTRPTPDTARWEQAYSNDEGRSWETNWIMQFTRR
jgi:hypothetical protein